MHASRHTAATGAGLLASCAATPGSATASGTPIEGGTLTVALPSIPDILDASITPAWNYPGRAVVDNLVDLDADGQIVPYLATSWEVNDDNTQFTFHLRDDVTFSNGEPLTANDVKATFDGAISFRQREGQGVAAGYLTGPPSRDLILKASRPKRKRARQRPNEPCKTPRQRAWKRNGASRRKPSAKPKPRKRHAQLQPQPRRKLPRKRNPQANLSMRSRRRPGAQPQARPTTWTGRRTRSRSSKAGRPVSTPTSPARPLRAKARPSRHNIFKFNIFLGVFQVGNQ